MWGRDIHGLALQAVSLATTHFAEIQSYGSLGSGLAGGTCSTTPVAGPVVGDYTGAVRYTFSSVAAGTTKTVKFTYRVDLAEIRSRAAVHRAAALGVTG